MLLQIEKKLNNFYIHGLPYINSAGLYIFSADLHIYSTTLKYQVLILTSLALDVRSAALHLKSTEVDFKSTGIDFPYSAFYLKNTTLLFVRDQQGFVDIKQKHPRKYKDYNHFNRSVSVLGLH